MNIQSTQTNSAQIRSARALLGWSQRELARRAQVGTSTVADFERGARAPTNNNVQSMVEALEKGGVEFTGNSVARRTAVAGSPRPVAGRTPFRWIEVADLDAWANRRDSQGLLPELVCRLIRADRGLEAELRLPSSDAVSMKGWDGECRVVTGSTYVPSGASGWEMSVQKDDIKGKADDDYHARTTSPGNLDPAQSTFVFLTARRMERKDEWIKTKKSGNRWQDVRAHDAVDLVHWLESFPSVASWLAGIMGKRPAGLIELEAAWKEWSLATERPMVPALVLAGRDEETMRCIKWAQESPSSLSLQAESAAEATAFIYAAITQLPSNEHAAFLTRCLVVKNADQARKLGQSLTALYLILEDADAGLARWLVGQGHHVCMVFGSDIGIPADVIRLPRVLRPDTEAALASMGYQREEARTLSRDIGGSLAVFRRLYPSVPERALPDWARPENAGDVLSAFFAGAWDENQPADNEMLQRLANKPYDEFEKGLALSSLPDSPLRKSGSIWKVASPRDALFRLAPVISAADLKRFSEIIGEVFRASDPRYSISPDERWLAPMRGQMPSHSAFLRAGLGETLLVIALFGEKANVAGSTPVVEKVVRDLLQDADAKRWWSLSGLMRLLAEAAPEQFLAALSDSLQKNDPPVMELFKEDSGGIFGAAHHSDLLWAMESLAWNPKYLGQAACLLARMARLDPPGGHYTNRPLNSLRNIFVWWMPQTCADFADRMDVVDLIRKEDAAIAWKLMLTLLPGDHEFLNPSQKPQWREIPPELPEQGNTHALLREAEAIAVRLLEDVGATTERWVSLIESFPKLPRKYLEQAGAELSARAHSFDDNDRNAVWGALRQLLHKHRNFADADWALPEEILSPLDSIYAAFAPSDPIKRIAWLFNGDSAPLPEKLEGGWEAYEAEAEVRRRKVVGELWADAGPEGIERLAQVVPQPWLIGFALAEVGLSANDMDAILVRSLEVDDPKLEPLARGLIGKTLDREKAADRGDVWAFGLLDRATAEAWSKRRVLAVLAMMEASRKLWDRVEQFGPDISDAYWKQLNPFRVPPTPEDIAVAIEKFMKQKRAGALLSMVSRTPAGVPSATIVEILREAVHSLDDQTHSNDFQMFQYHLEKLLTELDKRNDVDEKTIAQLEWLYLPLLRHSKRPPKTLHKSLSESPTFFVEVLKTVYRSSLEADAAEKETDEDERHKRLVTQAYELLNSWHDIPGIHNGVIDGAKLESWVVETRRLANEAGRIGPCDVYIGKVLARAPNGDDGIWPAAAVRNVIEISRSEVIERNIASGVLDRRGVTFRNPDAGGEQEWDLVKQYRTASEALRFKSPRTSAALEGVAQMFEGFAKRHDQDVERSNWQ